MQPKKYSSNVLKEIHADDVDILGHHHDTMHVMEIHSNEHSFNKVNQGGEGVKVVKQEKITPYGYRDMTKAFIVETIACIVLVLIENYSKGDLNVAIFGIFALVLALYPVSGANTNAFMSLALWWYEEEFVSVHIIRRFGYMLIIQPFGFFIGQMLSWGVIGPDLVYLKPKDTDPIKIAFAEFLFTGALIFAALHFIVSRWTRPTDQIGLNFIFFVVGKYFFIKAAHPISGGSLNPTKYLVNQAIAYHRGIEPNAFQNWYCYIFPQFLGTVFICLSFKYFFEPTYYRLITLKYKWEDKFYPNKYL